MHDDVVGHCAAVPFAKGGDRTGHDQGDGQGDASLVEDDRATCRVDVARDVAGIPVEARNAPDHKPRRRRQAQPTCEHRLARGDEVDDLDRELSVQSSRAQHRRAIGIRLIPLEWLLVEPADAAAELDAEPELPEVLAVIHVRPEEPLDLAPRAECCEQRAVAEDRGRAEGETPPRRVARLRELLLQGHQPRTRSETTGDVETEPSLALTTATSETVSPRLYRRGSRKTRYGAPSSTPSRAQAFAPGRRTANVTLTGSPPATVAVTTFRFVNRSAPIRSVTRAAPRRGS